MGHIHHSNASSPRKRFGVIAWLITVSLLIILLLIAITAYKTKQVADVQNALQRDWEISFNTDTSPSLLPEVLDARVKDYLIEKFDVSSATIGKKNRGYVYHDRFQFLFRGPITEIGIYYPENFDGDKLGKALRRFSKLNKLTIYENEDDYPSEADWKRLCEHLREMPSLTTIEFGGERIRDEAISPLKGHPALTQFTISYGKITATSAETFKMLPQLKQLNLEEIYLPNSSSVETETSKLGTEFRSLLSGVKINAHD